MSLMDTDKKEIKFIGFTIITWFLWDLLFDLVGVVINALEREVVGDFFFVELKSLLFKLLVFGVVFIFAFALTRRERLSIYLYVLFQMVIFHFIFIANLTSETGRLQFWARTESWDYKYLEAHLPILSFRLETVYPMYGTYDEGMFIPNSLWLFYFRWIILTLGYLLLVTWLTDQVHRRWFKKAFKLD
jgi:hypothetical protein